MGGAYLLLGILANVLVSCLIVFFEGVRSANCSGRWQLVLVILLVLLILWHFVGRWIEWGFPYWVYLLLGW